VIVWTAMAQSLHYRADQAGWLVAGAGIPVGFQRTLMPRSAVDQAIVTGLSVAATHALTSFVQECLQSAALLTLRERDGSTVDDRHWSRNTLAIDGAALALGVVAQRALRQRSGERLGRAGARTSAFLLATSAAAGGVIGGLQQALHRVGRERDGFIVPVSVPAIGVFAAAGEVRRRRAEATESTTAEAPPTSLAKSLVLGAGVALGASGMGAFERRFADRITDAAARVLPGKPAVWRPLAHATALAAIGMGMRGVAHRAFSRVEAREESVEAAFDLPPPTSNVSGSTESGVPFATLARQGRRFVWTITTAARIEAVMDEPAKATPIRVYVGLESGPTEEERVALAVAELERTGAFDRTHLMLVSPTGTGYVNYAAVSALEFLTRGDCATVAMQYAARPSVLSLDRVRQGRVHMRLLVDAVRQRLESRPAHERPTVVLFGESLGAWTSQDAFVGRGTVGLADAGIDYAIWIGTPYFSEWKEQVLRDGRPDVDAETVCVCNDIAELQSLPPTRKERVRFVMITHHDDGVAWFGPQLAIQSPPWLGPREERPSGVPKGMRWLPPTTFVQVLVDMKNSANVVPGVFEAKGHDYRADLLPFFHELLGLDASEEQLQRVAAALEQTELRRSRWLQQHGVAGKSLAAAVATRWLEQERLAGRDPDAVLTEAVLSLVAELDDDMSDAAASQPPR
jgi:uncharacterized membrane protein